MTSDGGATAVPSVEADDIAAAVLACPSVVGLHTGGPRAVATLLPGRRVDGVRLDESGVQVSVVARLGVSIAAVDREVRGAMTQLAQGRPVHVHVADVRAPQEPEVGGSGAPAGAA